MRRPVTVDFFFAPTSRYAYLASTRMLALQLETGCRVDWYPLHLADLQAAAGHDMVRYGRLASGQYDAAWRGQDAASWAELYGVPYRDPAGIAVPDPRRLALACRALGRPWPAPPGARAAVAPEPQRWVRQRAQRQGRKEAWG